MSITIERISTLTGRELDDLFRHGEVGPIPNGEAEGTAIVAPGTPLEGPLAKVIRRVAWQGKVFDAEAGTLRNKILPTGLQAIVADVYTEDSWLDQRDCIVLDYSKSSLIAQRVRDELRRVGDGLYLGIVYWGRTKLLHFTLQFPA